MKTFLKRKKSDEGFSLVEALVAIVVLLIVLLGVFSVFTYAIMFNTGNNNRSQALSVLQKEVEFIRSMKFTAAKRDEDIKGGTKAPKEATAGDGSRYTVEVTIDDDPFTDGIDVDDASTLKEITIKVAPVQRVAAWQSAVASEVVMRRGRAN